MFGIEFANLFAVVLTNTNLKEFIKKICQKKTAPATI